MSYKDFFVLIEPTPLRNGIVVKKTVNNINSVELRKISNSGRDNGCVGVITKSNFKIKTFKKNLKPFWMDISFLQEIVNENKENISEILNKKSNNNLVMKYSIKIETYNFLNGLELLYKDDTEKSFFIPIDKIDFIEERIRMYKNFIKDRKTEEKQLHCSYCEEVSNRLTFDHFIPKSLGGVKGYNVCVECNTLKSNLIPDEFVALLKFKLTKNEKTYTVPKRDGSFSLFTRRRIEKIILNIEKILESGIHTEEFERINKKQ